MTALESHESCFYLLHIDADAVVHYDDDVDDDNDVDEERKC